MRLSQRRLRVGGEHENVLLAAPAVVIYLALVIGPVFLTAYYSFTSWNGTSAEWDFVGVANYQKAFESDEVMSSFLLTFLITVGTSLALTLIAVPLAALLNRNGFVTRVYRSAIFFPIVLAPVVVGFIWQTLLNTNGIVNSALSPLGGEPINFLGNGRMAAVSIAIVAGWQTLGFITVLYLAAIQGIPGELYEAASMDGAGAVRTFVSITLPSLAPAIAANSVLLIVIFMRIYEYVVAMTGGGPAGSTETVAFLITQEAFVRSRFGLASGIAVLLIFAVAVMIGALRAISAIAGRRR